MRTTKALTLYNVYANTTWTLSLSSYISKSTVAHNLSTAIVHKHVRIGTCIRGAIYTGANEGQALETWISPSWIYWYFYFFTIFLIPDLDECTTGLHSCDSSASNCHNIIGSYQCNCAQGYQNFVGKINCHRTFLKDFNPSGKQKYVVILFLNFSCNYSGNRPLE